MTLTQLRYLVAIADSGLNITLAAERVHATQPGLSKQLKQLEDELGFLLFARKGRSLESVTSGGRQVLAHARRMLAEAGNIRSYAANQRGEAHGRLTIATTHTQARFVLPPVVARVKQAYPQVSIHLHPVPDAEVLSHRARGEAESAGFNTGRFGTWIYSHKRALWVATFIVAGLVLMFWSQPTAWTRSSIPTLARAGRKLFSIHPKSFPELLT